MGKSSGDCSNAGVGESGTEDHFRSPPQRPARNRRPGRNLLITWSRHYPFTPSPERYHLKTRQTSRKKRRLLQSPKRAPQHNRSSADGRAKPRPRSALANRSRGPQPASRTRRGPPLYVTWAVPFSPWRVNFSPADVRKDPPCRSRSCRDEEDRLRRPDCCPPEARGRRSPPAAAPPCGLPGGLVRPALRAAHVTAARSRGAGLSGAAPQGTLGWTELGSLQLSPGRLG